MYTVLIIDDERLIREGISKSVNWEALKLRLIGTAIDGQDGYEKIISLHPDIVLTDIVMPELTGLELIKEISATEIQPEFIILSGYNEFEFARQAMQNGIKYYLVKPTGQEEIEEILKKVIEKLNAANEQIQLVASLNSEIENIIPLVRKQFLRDCIVGRFFSNQRQDYFKKLLDINTEEIQLILLKPIVPDQKLDLLTLERICTHSFKQYNPLITIVLETIIIMMQPIPETSLFTQLHKIRELYCQHNNNNITIAISRKADFREINSLYTEAYEYLRYSFFFGEGSIITEKDLDLTTRNSSEKDLDLEFEELFFSVKCGDLEGTELSLGKMKKYLESGILSKNQVINYIAEKLLYLYRQNESIDISESLNDIEEIRQCKSLLELMDFFELKIFILAKEKSLNLGNIRSKLIRRLIDITEENIQKEILSLKWLSETQVFANSDYLSKLFKKETGQKFSKYVTELRINRAKELLKSPHTLSIAEVAEQTGFSTNPQYFSQVFRKVTGETPTEYKKNH